MRFKWTLKNIKALLLRGVALGAKIILSQVKELDQIYDIYRKSYHFP
jgi:hypothetical protein